jgi:predicted dehydrogenase
MLDRSDVDAVAVCVPSGLHAGVGEQVLQAGKHLLMEKPLDVTLAAADRVIAAERAAGRTVGVVSQRRFQPAFAFLHDLVESGRIGRVTSGLSESPFWRTQDYYDGGDWRGTVELDGGGALMNQGIHGLDILLWLLGEPVEVSARWATLAHERIEVEDTLSATIVFDSGAVGTMTATTAAYPGRSVRVTLSGTDGTAIVDDERLVLLQLRDGSSGDDALGRQPGPDPGVLDTTQSLGAQYADFAEAVESGRPPLVGTTQARLALATVLAIYESARAGGMPTTVDRPGAAGRRSRGA